MTMNKLFSGCVLSLIAICVPSLGGEKHSLSSPLQCKLKSLGTVLTLPDGARADTEVLAEVLIRLQKALENENPKAAPLEILIEPELSILPVHTAPSSSSIEPLVNVSGEEAIKFICNLLNLSPEFIRDRNRVIIRRNNVTRSGR